MTSWPAMKPRAICIYPKPETATIPGTETYVTPDIAEPIIAKATTYHDCFLLPVKKLALSDLRPESQAMRSTNAKYAAIVRTIVNGFIFNEFSTTVQKHCPVARTQD